MSSRYGTSYTAPAGFTTNTRPGSSTSSPPAQTSAALAGGNTKNSANVAAIAGGVAGGIAGIILLGSLAYYLIKKHAQSRADSAALDDDLFGAGVGVGGEHPIWPDMRGAGVGYGVSGQGASGYDNPFAGNGAGAASAPPAQQPAAWAPYHQQAGAGYGGGAGYAPGPGADGAGAGAGYGGSGGQAGWAHDGGMGASAGPGAAQGAAPWSPGGGTQNAQTSQPNGTSGTVGLVAAWAQAQRQQTQTPDARQSVLSHPTSSGSAYADGATASSVSGQPMRSPTGHNRSPSGGEPSVFSGSGWSGVPEVQDREH